MIKDVSELRVFQQSLNLLREVYKLTATLPKSSERLRKQIEASTESIPALIAEGFGKRRSAKEFKRFIEMAMGSSDETIAHLQVIMILAERWKVINTDLCNRIQTEYKHFSRQLNNLRNYWKSDPLGR